MDDPLQMSIGELVDINQSISHRSTARRSPHVHVALLLHDRVVFNKHISLLIFYYERYYLGYKQYNSQ